MYQEMSLADLGEISKGRWDAASRAGRKAARASKRQARRQANPGPVGRARNAVNEDISEHLRNAEEGINRNVHYATGPGAEQAGRNFAAGAAEGFRQSGPRLRNEAWKYGGVAAGTAGLTGGAIAVPVIATREHKAGLERRQAKYFQQNNLRPLTAASSERRRRAG